MSADWTAGSLGPVLYVGIDASIRAIGFSWRVGDGPVDTYTVDGVAMLETDHAVRLAADTYGRSIRLVAVIECPTWSGHGTREVRAAVTQVEKRLQAWFPVRSIRRVDPNVWQREALAGAPGETSKERSLFVARTVLGLSPANDHEADAIHLMEWAIRQHRGDITKDRQMAIQKRVAKDRAHAQRRREGR